MALSEPNINFISGAHVTIVTADNPGLEAVDVTISSTGVSPTDTAGWMPLTTVVAGVPDLVWDAGNSLIPTWTPF